MLIEILALTFVFELATIVGRLLFGSKKERFKKNTSRYKVRIHHGYTGAILVIIAYLLQNEYLMILGWAFFLSDFVHHFFVLPLWVRRTEFP